MVRNYLVPVAGILVLITQPGAWQGQGTWPKVIATVFGLLVIVVVINAINHLVFHRGEKGSWRDRFPTIFSDLIRFVFIIVGIALVFWWVWDADVAGVFAALGITSIVVGLALQNAVGSIVSGLFLIFEAPFELGDWIETGGTRGQIIEVNWRAVHLDTGNGIVVMPTAELAEGSFTNLSRVADPYAARREVVVRDRRPARAGARAARRRSRATSRSSRRTASRASTTLAGAKYRGRDPAAQRRATRKPCSTPSRRASGTPRAAPTCTSTATSPTSGTRRRGCRTPCTRSRRRSASDRAMPRPSPRTARLERYCAGRVDPAARHRADRDAVHPRRDASCSAVPTDAGFVQVTELGRDDAVGLTALTRDADHLARDRAHRSRGRHDPGAGARRHRARAPRRSRARSSARTRTACGSRASRSPRWASTSPPGATSSDSARSDPEHRSGKLGARASALRRPSERPA